MENVLTKNISGTLGDCSYVFCISRNKNYVKKDHLISVVFFVLPCVDETYASQKAVTLDELRAEHEKKMNAYLNGLDNIVTKCGEKFNVRIYCDVTSDKLVEKYLGYRNVEIHSYYFRQIFDEVRNCHYGFFGTLIRYIPLFNFPKLENNWETVTILDLDNNFFGFKDLISYFTESKDETNLMFWSRPCYFLSPRMYAMTHRPNQFCIISSFLMQRKQQDYKLFANFLNQCILNRDEEYMNSLGRHLSVDLSERPFEGRLEYGVDEYFINHWFLNENYLKRNLSFNMVVYSEVAGGFLEWIKHIRFMIPRVKITNEKATKEFMQLIVDTFYPKGTSLPKLPINELIDWVGEKYYELNLQYLHRKVDQSADIRKFMDKLKEKKFKTLDVYDEYLYGLELNTKLKPNHFEILLIEPAETYPNFTDRIVASLSRS